MNYYYKTIKASALLADPTLAQGWQLRMDDTRDGWWQFVGVTQESYVAKGVRIEVGFEDTTFPTSFWAGDIIKARRPRPAANTERGIYTADEAVEAIAHGSVVTVRPLYSDPFKIEVIKPKDGFMVPMVFSPTAVNLHGRKMTMRGQYSRQSVRDRAGLTRPMLVHAADITHIAAPAATSAA